jgi:hypothetical protein
MAVQEANDLGKNAREMIAGLYEIVAHETPDG